MIAVKLEPARIRDAAAIAALSKRLVEPGVAPAWTLSRVERAIRNPDCRVLIARINQDLVGFALLEFEDLGAHLNLLAVSPNQQRKGVGRRLMHALQAHALELGATRMTLECRASNTSALRFYDSLGYEQIRILPRYYEDHEEAVRLGRSLQVSVTS